MSKLSVASWLIVSACVSSCSSVLPVPNSGSSLPPQPGIILPDPRPVLEIDWQGKMRLFLQGTLPTQPSSKSN